MYTDNEIIIIEKMCNRGLDLSSKITICILCNNKDVVNNITFNLNLKSWGKEAGKMHQIPSVSSSSGRPTCSTWGGEGEGWVSERGEGGKNEG